MAFNAATFEADASIDHITDGIVYDLPHFAVKPAGAAKYSHAFILERTFRTFRDILPPIFLTCSFYIIYPEPGT
jgi:hypothetical protein